MTIAKTLRSAATTLRAAAQDATPGPWRQGGSPNKYAALVADKPHPDRMPGGGWQWDDAYGGCLVGESHMAQDRVYLIAMNPCVGLALADWLDEAAEETADMDDIYAKYIGHDRPGWAQANAALAVARAILQGTWPS